MIKKKREKKNDRRRPWILLLSFAGAILLGFYILSLPIWQIKEVVVNGTQMLSPDQVKALAAIPLSENLFYANFSRARDNLGKIHAIKEVKFYRIPPATVLISVKERKPIAMAVFPSKSVIIDEEGFILNPNPNIKLYIPDLAKLPVISGMSAEALRSVRVDEKVAEVVAHIVAKLSPFLEADRMRVELGGMKNASLILDDLLRVKVGDTDKIRTKMEILIALLPEVNGKWPQVEYIDLRYPDNPVIKLR